MPSGQIFLLLMFFFVAVGFVVNFFKDRKKVLSALTEIEPDKEFDYNYVAKTSKAFFHIAKILSNLVKWGYLRAINTETNKIESEVNKWDLFEKAPYSFVFIKDFHPQDYYVELENEKQKTNKPA